MSNQIWRCPECDTVNSGEKCIVCGADKVVKYNADIENNSETQSTNQPKPIKSNSNNPIHRGSSNAPVQPAKKQGNNIVIVYAVIVTLVLIVTCMFVIPMISNSSNDESENIIVSDTVGTTISDETVTSSLTQMTATETEVITVPEETTTTEAESTTVSETTVTNEAVTSSLTQMIATEMEETTIEAETTTVASETEAAEWSETEIKETLYIQSVCYSRKEAIVGSESVKKYSVGAEVNIVAVTDTGYYKLKDGTYIHSDYVTDLNNQISYYSDGTVKSQKTKDYSDGSYEITWYWQNGLEKFVEKYDKYGNLINLKSINIETREIGFDGMPTMTEDGGYYYKREHKQESYPYFYAYVNSEREITSQKYVGNNVDDVIYTCTSQVTEANLLIITWYNEDNEKVTCRTFDENGKLIEDIDY